MSRLALALAGACLLVPATSAQAQEITVMTRNVFLGADLSPVIGAESIGDAINGAGTVWNEVQTTNFAERAVPLAKEIKASKADLVGLQEVALWQSQTPSDGGAPPISPVPGAVPASTVAFDFLALLREQLGNRYRVVIAQEEFQAELPVNADGNLATGTGPLAGFGADLDARLTMRDVILIRKGSKVKLGKIRKGHYKTRFEANVGGIKIPADRGWVSVDARVGKKQFRFVNTHLEAFGDPKIREAQAKELMAGPLKTKKQVVLVGDLNSGVKRHKQPEKPGDDLAFKALKGFKDNGARQTCCFGSLTDPKAVFDHTVDHVLTKPGLKTVRARVTGNDPSARTPSGLWPSDHGGVVSRLRLRG
jgi:endonuclease/exonuclease/phosphatase family metal-dependent hydrolase